MYASQAKKGQEIEGKLKGYIKRAERKLGQILQAAKAAGQITHSHGNQWVVDGDDNAKVKLSEAGISRDLSSRAQKLARMSEGDFEQMLAKQKNGQRRNKPPKAHERAPEIIDLHDKGKTQAGIARETGISQRQVRHTLEEEKIWRAGFKEGEQQALDKLALQLEREAKSQRIERAMQALYREFDRLVDQEVEKRLEFRKKTLQEGWQKDLDEARKVMEGRKGFMKKGTYRLILS